MFLSFFSCCLLQATFQVHQGKGAEVTRMLCVGEGVWISFKMDSVLRLYNATSFAHMQDLNIAPSIHKILGRCGHMHMHVTSCV